MKCYVLDGEWAPKPNYVPGRRELRDRGRTMDASACYKNVHARIEERELPQIQEDEVLLRIGACGICGSDIHSVQCGSDGYSRYGNHLRLPVILGHEFSGEVVEVGKKVSTVKAGDLLAVEQIRWCGKCHACRIGMFNQCYEMEEIGLSADGGLAEYVSVPEKYCCNISALALLYGSKHAALEAGALVEPTAVAFNGMMVSGGGFKPGSHIVVYGAGPIGLVAIGLARACGAAKIFCIETVSERLKLAKTMGADLVINPLTLPEGVRPSTVVLDATSGLGAGMIVEATGAYAAVYPEIEAMLAIGAKVVQLGISPTRAQLSMIRFQVSGSRIQGSLGQAGSDIFPSVIRLMEAGRIDMRPIITARFPLLQAGEAINLAMRPGQGKVMVING